MVDSDLSLVSHVNHLTGCAIAVVGAAITKCDTLSSV